MKKKKKKEKAVKASVARWSRPIQAWNMQEKCYTNNSKYGRSTYYDLKYWQ
jgi:hypothetical protein